MANRTVKEAKNVHGTNPQYLIEKIIRSRIYDSKERDRRPAQNNNGRSRDYYDELEEFERQRNRTCNRDNQHEDRRQLAPRQDRDRERQDRDRERQDRDRKPQNRDRERQDRDRMRERERYGERDRRERDNGSRHDQREREPQNERDRRRH
ncbi:pre-mRNA-splicing factor 38-like [Drosophila miranda]|uniref:pre-mRNA-splicing factor 38-like n=1 Tax=Drosophila miranda TaxID=7229 RepID=UPI00143F5454|nr:pre-mRNA-splicing factor 38-like [Drosophila miranda]